MGGVSETAERQAQLDRIETKLDEVLLFINKADALIGVFSGGKYKGVAAILKAK